VLIESSCILFCYQARQSSITASRPFSVRSHTFLSHLSMYFVILPSRFSLILIIIFLANMIDNGVCIRVWCHGLSLAITFPLFLISLKQNVSIHELKCLFWPLKILFIYFLLSGMRSSVSCVRDAISSLP
jgi:hypothetical protein